MKTVSSKALLKNNDSVILEKDSENILPGGGRPLGNTGLILSELGFGCAGAWGKSMLGKPMINDIEAAEIVEKAYNLGIRWFDTGFNYGFAEERLGNILKTSKVLKRENIVLSTKFGERWVDDKWVMDWSPEWMRESLRISMERLGVDSLDMLMCHGGKVSDIKPDLIEAMQELKQKGIVKAIGISMCDEEMIRYILKTRCFDFVMLRYNVLMQQREPLIQELYENGIGVLAGAPLAESLYSNSLFKVRSIKDIWYIARAFINFREFLIKGRKFTFIDKVDGLSGSQIALKYVLDNPNITAAVFGTTSLDHLIDNCGSVNIEIPNDILRKIKHI